MCLCVCVCEHEYGGTLHATHGEGSQCREESELEGVARSLRFLYLCGEDHCSVCNLWGEFRLLSLFLCRLFVLYWPLLEAESLLSHDRMPSTFSFARGSRNVVCIARTHKGHSSRHSTPPVNRKCIYIGMNICACFSQCAFLSSFFFEPLSLISLTLFSRVYKLGCAIV